MAAVARQPAINIEVLEIFGEIRRLIRRCQHDDPAQAGRILLLKRVPQNDVPQRMSDQVIAFRFYFVVDELMQTIGNVVQTVPRAAYRGS